MSNRDVRILIGLLLAIFLINCVACSEKDDPAGPSKNLFSVWMAGESVLDLSAATFGTNLITYSVTADSGCDCTLDITGSQLMGSAILSNCTPYGPENLCSNKTYSYTNDIAYLILCPAGGPCQTYK